MEKLEWLGYMTVKNEDMFSCVDRIPTCDRRTDRQTSCDGIIRAVHMRRAVKSPNIRGGSRVGLEVKALKCWPRPQIPDT